MFKLSLDSYILGSIIALGARLEVCLLLSPLATSLHIILPALNHLNIVSEEHFKFQ